MQCAQDAPKIKNYPRWLLRVEADLPVYGLSLTAERMAQKTWLGLVKQVNEEAKTTKRPPWQRYKLTTVEGQQRYLDIMRRGKDTWKHGGGLRV